MKDLHGTKLITIDMDDTLLHTDKTISEYTIEVLQKACDRGILIVPCSGRAYSGMPAGLQQIQGIRYSINLNGGIITDVRDSRIVYRNSLSEEDARSIYDSLTVFHSPRTVFTDGPALMAQEDREQIREFAFPNMVPYYLSSRTFVEDVFTALHTGAFQPVKITAMIHSNGSDLPLILQELDRYPSFSTTHSPDCFEVTPMGVTKGNGLLTLCKIAGIDREDTVAFGDSTNDASALHAAGFAVAVENAVPELKEIADAVTLTNDHDGVAKFIDRMILQG